MKSTRWLIIDTPKTASSSTRSTRKATRLPMTLGSRSPILIPLSPSTTTGIVNVPRSQRLGGSDVVQFHNISIYSLHFICLCLFRHNKTNKQNTKIFIQIIHYPLGHIPTLYTVCHTSHWYFPPPSLGCNTHRRIMHVGTSTCSTIVSSRHARRACPALRERSTIVCNTAKNSRARSHTPPFFLESLGGNVKPWHCLRSAFGRQRCLAADKYSHPSVISQGCAAISRVSPATPRRPPPALGNT